MAANPLIDMGDQAAANTRSNVAQENNNIVADQQRQTLPYSMAIKGLQDKLQTIDQKANPQDYNDTVDKIQQNIHAMREIFHPDAKLGAGDWLKTHTTDRLHITNHDARVKDLAAKNAVGTTQDASQATAIAQGTPDEWGNYAALYQRVTGQPPSDQTKQQWAEKKGGVLSVNKPNLKNFRGPNGEIQTLDANKPESIPSGFVLDTKQPANNLKPIVSGGVPIGIPFNGKVFTVKDMKDPDTPQQVKDEWDAMDAGAKAKNSQFEQRRQENYRHMEQMQARSIAASNQRAMYSFQNALAMGQFKPAEGLMTKQEQQVYQDKGMMAKMNSLMPDALAGNQQAQLAILMNHVAMTTHQPGAAQRATRAMVEEAEKSAPWLQNVEKRYGPDGYLEGVTLSPEQIQNMVELAPNTLAADSSVLEGMKKDYGVGGTDGTVTPLPAQVKPLPAGPKTQSLKKPAGGGAWKAPADAPPAPKEDNHLLKKGGTVIAKSQGGQWVKP